MRKFNLLPALLLIGGLALGSSPAGAVEQATAIGPATLTTQPASPAGTEVAAAPGAWRSLEGCIPPAPGEWSGYDIWNAYICPPGTPGAVD